MVEEIIEISEHKGNNFSKQIKKNPWMAATGVFVIISIILVILLLRGGSGSVSSDVAGQKTVSFLNQYVVSDNGVTLGSVNKSNGLYIVNVNYNNQTIPVSMTADGKFIDFGGGIVNIDAYSTAKSNTNTNTNTQPSATAPKSDKPDVSLFVFAYCPYGLQAEKGFIPVYNVLKNYANINIDYIGAMHGPFEETESLRQLCIKKNYGEDVFMNYASQFAVNTAIGNCNGDDKCLAPLISGIMTPLGIDANKINTCMTADAPALYSAEEAKASQLGVSGSPTLVINGVDVSPSGRNSQAFLTAICSAFNNAPAVCAQPLSATEPAAGFGGGTGSGSAASCG